MLGHAVPPDGHAVLVVLTVNVVFAPRVYPVGKTTSTNASVAVEDGLAHTVPVVAVLIFIRSKRTATSVSEAADAERMSANGTKRLATSSKTADIFINFCCFWAYMVNVLVIYLYGAYAIYGLYFAWLCFIKQGFNGQSYQARRDI
jgi:hypothetical protein